eukprot:gene429-901_t
MVVLTAVLKFGISFLVTAGVLIAAVHYNLLKMGDDSATKTIIKTAITSLIVIGTCLAIWGIATADFSSIGKSSSDKFKKKKKKKEGEENIWIYYGSQTGTAETFANEIGTGCQKLLGEKAKVMDLEDWESDAFVKNKIVIFAVATYGEGDPTDNAMNFYEWMIGEQDSEMLQDMTFAVFGLGNTQYVSFNAMGKSTDSHLERLGAKRFYNLGLGNDDQDIEADFDAWLPGLFEALATTLVEKGIKTASEINLKSQEVSMDKPVLPLVLQMSQERSDLPLDPMVKNGGNDTLSKALFTTSKAKVVEKRELKQQNSVKKLKIKGIYEMVKLTMGDNITDLHLEQVGTAPQYDDNNNYVGGLEFPENELVLPREAQKVFMDGVHSHHPHKVIASRKGVEPYGHKVIASKKHVVWNKFDLAKYSAPVKPLRPGAARFRMGTREGRFLDFIREVSYPWDPPGEKTGVKVQFDDHPSG